MNAFERNVLIYGAVADGKTDCTAAFQQALDEAGCAGGGIVQVPAGKYAFSGRLKVPAYVDLAGVSQAAPPSSQQGGYREGMPSYVVLPEDQMGTVLLVTAGKGEEGGEAFLTLDGENASVSGLTFLYPEADGRTVPPVPYSPTVSAAKGATNVGVHNVMFLGSYEAIRMVSAPRHHLDRITGYPLKRGILVDDCGDIGHIDNVHFWPFGFLRYRTQEGLGEWVAGNGVAYEIARSDWEYVTNTFCFGYGVGYKFTAGANARTGLGGGGMNGHLSGIGADCCQRAIFVEAALPFGVLITNATLTGRWASTDAVALEIAPGANCTFQIQNSTFFGPLEKAVLMRDEKSQLTLNGCHFGDWVSCAVELEAGMATIQGCSFGFPCDLDNPIYNAAMANLAPLPHSDTCVKVGEKVRCALMSGNLAVKGFLVENRAGDRAQCFCNQTV